MTAYQKHRELIKKFRAGEKINLTELTHTRRAAETAGRKAVARQSRR